MRNVLCTENFTFMIMFLYMGIAYKHINLLYLWGLVHVQVMKVSVIAEKNYTSCLNKRGLCIFYAMLQQVYILHESPRKTFYCLNKQSWCRVIRIIHIVSFMLDTHFCWSNFLLTETVPDSIKLAFNRVF